MKATREQTIQRLEDLVLNYIGPPAANAVRYHVDTGRSVDMLDRVLTNNWTGTSRQQSEAMNLLDELLED